MWARWCYSILVYFIFQSRVNAGIICHSTMYHSLVAIINLRGGVAARGRGGQPPPPRRGHHQLLGAVRGLHLRPARAPRPQEGVCRGHARRGPDHLRGIRSVQCSEGARIIYWTGS